MPVYEYTALDLKGKTVSGIIDAESTPAARQKLRASKKYPIDIHETERKAEKTENRSRMFEGLFTRVKPTEIAMMTRQLATLVGAGFPLVSALDTLIPQTKARGFQKTMAQIKDSIVEGNSFAASLSPFPNAFSSVYVNMVSAGETSGTLEIVLDRLADITEKQQALKQRIISAATYPLFMLTIGILVLFFLMTYIVPRISAIFEDMNQTLPAITRFLIASSKFLQSWWWLILVLLIGLFAVLNWLRKTKNGRLFFDTFILRTPLFGVLVQKLAVARFSRTLGSLLENGVTMLAALDIVKNIVGNSILSNAVSDAAREVGKGQGLGRALSGHDVFPSLFIQMVLVGEQSGELEKMLNKVADVYENEVESTIMRLTSLLEPTMIVVMAVVVGFIALSICLPIFEMRTLVR